MQVFCIWWKSNLCERRSKLRGQRSHSARPREYSPCQFATSDGRCARHPPKALEESYSISCIVFHVAIVRHLITFSNLSLKFRPQRNEPGRRSSGGTSLSLTRLVEILQSDNSSIDPRQLSRRRLISCIGIEAEGITKDIALCIEFLKDANEGGFTWGTLTWNIHIVIALTAALLICARDTGCDAEVGD